MFDKLAEIICNYVDVEKRIYSPSHALWRI